MRRADHAAPGLPPLRELPRAAGRAAEGRLTLAARVVCLFPGQGAQRVGMGRTLAAAHPLARRTFEEVDERLGYPLSTLCFEGPAETLELTEHAQPALLAHGVAAYRVARERTGLAPIAMAGHSLGEWTALVAAGALGLGDAAAGVRERGRLMQQAVPVGSGAMAALLGAPRETVDALCAAAADGCVLAPANLNGGGQIVVAGHAAAVDRLLELAKAARIRAQRLPVSAPFHCPLMAPAAAGVARFLAEVAVRAPEVPVYTSVEARPVAGPEDVRAVLERQVTAPVRWEETMQALAAAGPDLAVELGAGRALAGLWKRTVPGVPVLSAGDPESLDAVGEALA